jgi:hypothetical protein
MAVPIAQQLAWKERELAGERALRQGWEAECRRTLEQNKLLRRLLLAVVSTRSAGRP